jgi:N-acyl-L-homoserine lactone synthetase
MFELSRFLTGSEQRKPDLKGNAQNIFSIIFLKFIEFKSNI